MRGPLRKSQWIAIAIVIGCFIVRGTVCFYNVKRYQSDPDAYVAIAETLAGSGVFGRTDVEGRVHSTAYRPPLYPFLLSRMVFGGELSPYAVALFHTLLAGVTAWCVFRISRRLLMETDSARGSITAAVLVIIDPVLVQQSTYVMSETLATALATLAIWWWVRHTEWSSGLGSACVLGILLALAYCCRPTFLVWAMMFCGCVIFTRPYRSVSRWLQVGRAGLAAVIVLLAVGFWTLRNVREMSHPVWATTHGGYTLLLGNNPLFYDYLRDGSFMTAWDASQFLETFDHRYDRGADPTTAEFWEKRWEGPSAIDGKVVPQVSEIDDDRLAYSAATATMLRRPGAFVWSCYVRVLRLWSPFPYKTPARSWFQVVAVGFYYLAFYVAVGFGIRLLRREIRQPIWWPMLALALALTAVHTVYWSNARMRAPFIPVLAVVAGAVARRRDEVSESEPKSK